LASPSDIVVDAAGFYIITDTGPPPALYRFTPGGAPQAILWQGAPLVSPSGVAVDLAGNYIVADAGPPPALYMFPPGGGFAIIWQGAPFVSPSGVAVDLAGNYIVADIGPPRLLLVPFGGGNPVILWQGGPLASPNGVAVDAAGNYIVADAGPPPALIMINGNPPGGGFAIIWQGAPFVSPSDVAIVPQPLPLSCLASASPVIGYAPLAVQFTASPSGGFAPYSYQWNFGDGATNASQNPIHVYQNSGTYAWTVDAYDSLAQHAFANGTVTVRANLAELSGFPSLPTGNMTMIIGDLTNNPHGSKPPGVNYQIGRDMTPLGFVSGMLANPQPSIFDTNSTWINATTGRPFSSIPPDLIFSIGGPGINSVSYYYENTTNMTDRAPIRFSMNATHYIWTNRTDDEVLAVLRSSCNVPPGTNDVFVIQVLRDADGRLVALMYGTHYTGTWAAAWWFKFVVYPNIASYQNGYYIVQWTDAASGTGSNYTPDLGDTYTILAQG